MAALAPTKDPTAAPRQEIVKPVCKTLSKSAYATCIKVIKTGIDYAKQKSEEAAPLESVEDFCVFNFSKLELEELLTSLEKPKDDENICICLDGSYAIQSIAAYDEPSKFKKSGIITVRNVATNPQNIPSFLNKQAGVTKASYHLVKYIEKLASANHCDLRLNPLGNSYRFYEQMGFALDEKSGFYVKKSAHKDPVVAS